MVVFFDLVGTLFSMDRVRAALGRHGLPDEFLAFWFARLLHVSMASTLRGEDAPFLAAAESALRQALAYRGYPAAAGPDALAAFRALEPFPDTRPCLGELRRAGHRVVALSNAPLDMQRALVDGNGLGDLFAAVISSDEVGHAKPHPAPYRNGLERMGVPAAEAGFVAAHAWDVLGAARAGLTTVWVSRNEKGWGFPAPPPGAVVETLAEVPAVIGARG